AAAEATRQGWRVVAFAFEDAPGLGDHADTVIPSRIDKIQAVLEGLTAQRVSAALFVGKFWKHRVFARHSQEADSASRHLATPRVGRACGRRPGRDGRRDPFDARDRGAGSTDVSPPVDGRSRGADGPLTVGGRMDRDPPGLFAGPASGKLWDRPDGRAIVGR